MLLRIEKVFEVDNAIASAIELLNKKGVGTLYSCSGHSKEITKYDNRYYLGAYVMFDRSTSMIIDSIPTNWVEDKHSLGSCKTIRRYFTEEEYNLFTHKQLINLSSKELLNWAKGLDEICNPYLYNLEVELVKDFTKDEPKDDINIKDIYKYESRFSSSDEFEDLY